MANKKDRNMIFTEVEPQYDPDWKVDARTCEQSDCDQPIGWGLDQDDKVVWSLTWTDTNLRCICEDCFIEIEERQESISKEEMLTKAIQTQRPTCVRKVKALIAEVYGDPRKALAISSNIASEWMLADGSHLIIDRKGTVKLGAF